MNGHQVSLIPDGFLAFHVRRHGLPDLSLPLILEHDRGTEQQEHFKWRIRAYKQLVGTERVTVAFTTFVSAKRVAQMREWTRAELSTEPQLAGMFIFAELPRPLELTSLLFERRWYTLTSDQPIALLEG
jgi:hypothetical protein